MIDRYDDILCSRYPFPLSIAYGAENFHHFFI
jgi:hypothetical protein